MSFDPVITNPGRLRILTALAGTSGQEFVHLRRTTRMTDGNLATHARRLESAGLVRIDKAFRDGKPVTTFILTDHGREALAAHVDQLTQALRPPVTNSAPFQTELEPETVTISASDSDWID